MCNLRCILSFSSWMALCLSLCLSLLLSCLLELEVALHLHLSLEYIYQSLNQFHAASQSIVICAIGLYSVYRLDMIQASSVRDPPAFGRYGVILSGVRGIK